MTRRAPTSRRPSEPQLWCASSPPGQRIPSRTGNRARECKPFWRSRHLDQSRITRACARVRGSARGAEPAARSTDFFDVVGGPGQENQARDIETLEVLAGARSRIEPARVEAGEDRQQERARVTAGRLVLVARDAREIGELGVHRLRVESIA